MNSMAEAASKSQVLICYIFIIIYFLITFAKLDKLDKKLDALIEKVEKTDG